MPLFQDNLPPRLDPPAHPSHHSFTCTHIGWTLSLRIFNQISNIISHIIIKQKSCAKYLPHTPSTPINKFCQEVNVQSHVICLTRQLSIHIWIVPVSPWRQWGIEWNPFQGKHYCPRGNVGAEFAHISKPELTSQHAHLQTHISFDLPDLCSAVLPLFEIQHRQRIQHHSLGS